MLVLLIMAAQPVQSAAPVGCEHLDEKHVTSLVKRTDNEVDINPYNAPSLGDLVKYWKRTCSNERYNTSKYIVRRLSSLLSHREVDIAIASMLVDVGPNLKASRRDLDAAISTATARENAEFEASRHIGPQSGRTVSYSLRCVKIKMLTGHLDWKYCLYINRFSF